VFQAENSPQRTAILDTLITVAGEIGVTPGEVAIAWVAAKGTFPIIGPRSVQQLEGNLAAAKIKLSVDHIARLDDVSRLPPIFPYSMIEEPGTLQRSSGGKYDQLDLPTTPVA
jgi:aryl-alcohol dehydrogenase-like predicted oxidoreductase